MRSRDAETFLFRLIPARASENKIKGIWQELDQTGGHSFFDTWNWQGVALGSFGEFAARAFLLAQKGSETIGLGAVSRKIVKYRGLFSVRQLHFNGGGSPEFDSLLIEHNGFACAQTVSRDLLLALVAAFREGKLGADELVLPGVSESLDEVLTRLDKVRRNRAYRVSLSGARGPQGAAGLLSRNSRQQLHRSIRACSALGPLKLKRAADVDEALACFAALKNFHIASWTQRGKTHAFRWPYFETFHRELIRASMEAGSVDLLEISAGSCRVGYLYNFYRNGTVSSYQSGFNPALAHLRPGYVCHALAIEHYAQRGAMTYDFLAGHNQLKQTFATEVYEMRWYRLRRPTLYFRAEAAIRGALGIS
jgi:CelD/BcsL family acetyltransferase involved in cellulose biosynthesis